MKKPPSKLLIFAALMVLISIIGGVFFMSSSGYNPLSAVLGELLVPVQKGANAISDRLYGFFEYFYKFDSLQAENEALKEKIAQYQAVERQYYAAIDENESLRVLARLSRENPTYDYEFCYVTAINMTGYSQTITIDKGSLDGIKLFNCAVVREGVVGYVSKVSASFSEITLLTDPDVKIGAVVSRPHEIVVAEGESTLMNEGKLRLAYLSNDTQAKVGDGVETSGYGDIFPRGLAIGYIDTIDNELHGMTKYAVLSPAVDLERLKKVYVIKSFSDSNEEGQSDGQ